MVEGDLARARLATENEKLRAALLNGVSHDLRTPFVTVIGALTATADGTLPPAQYTALTETAPVDPQFVSGAAIRMTFAATAERERMVPEPTPRILIIEDEAPIRRFLRIVHQGAGYTVDEAARGRLGGRTGGNRGARCDPSGPGFAGYRR